MINYPRQTRQYLDLIKDDIEQAAREIYYAIKLYEQNENGRINLEIALKLLGVGSPKDVGLSDRVLDKDK